MDDQRDVHDLAAAFAELGADAGLVEVVRTEAGDVARWLYVASVLRGSGDYHAALLTYEAAERRFPDAPALWNNKAILLREWGRLDEALSCVGRALELRPDYGNALWTRGLVFEQLHRPADAARDYRSLAGLEPDRPEAWNNLANAEKALGHRGVARELYERAIEADPGFVEALVNLAGLHYEDGERLTALPLIARALAIDPRDEVARALQAAVNDPAPPRPMRPDAGRRPTPRIIVRGTTNIDFDGTLAPADLSATEMQDLSAIMGADRPTAARTVGYRAWDIGKIAELVDAKVADEPKPVLHGPRLFISYRWESRPHKAWVRKLAMELKGRGYDVVLDRAAPDELPEVSELISRVAACSHFVAVLTEGTRRRVELAGGGSATTVIEDGYVFDEYQTACRLWLRDRIAMVGVWRSGPVVPLPFRPELVMDFRGDAGHAVRMAKFFPPVRQG